MSLLLRRGLKLVRRLYLPIYTHPTPSIAIGNLTNKTTFHQSERTKVRKAMENMLQKAALKIVAVVNRDKDHIPPITTSDSNPFPYRIVVNPRTDGWGLY